VRLPREIYVKRSRLLSWDPEDCGSIAALVLQEAEVCEILKKHPHPNIAQYHGCLVENGRITGLCFTNYKSDLERTLAKKKKKDITEKEKLAYSKGIGDGIRHLHQHNDINLSNMMIDGEKPVVIDFDSSRPIGEKLGDKVGTFEWELEGAEFSEPENDMYGLKKIQEVTLQVKSQEAKPEK
jgi:serine/threonine protein kinase